MTRSCCAGEDAVGQADAHHEVLGGFAFAVDATGDAEAVALGVDAPPLEVESGPLGEHGLAAHACELAYLVPGLPGILGELEAFDLLGLRLFDRCCWSVHAGHPCLCRGGLNEKAH